MDRPLRQELDEFMTAFAAGAQEQMAAAGTLVTLEELTAEIGDAIAGELLPIELD
ncbi:MAG: hypothetical protein KDA75_08430 [Planctomycetaceae bacterium]|nr:hypothetical protein [Planctomycetaceae bacterium]